MSDLAKQVESLALADMVGSFALSLARAQQALDSVSLRTAELMAQQQATFFGEQLSLLELGFAPTFYQFAESTLEVKASFSMTSAESQERTSSQLRAEAEASIGLGLGGISAGATTRVCAVDARFASRYSYSAEGSGMLSTRLVPVPPPAELMTRLLAIASEKDT
jgi:hypothetical protein